VKTPWRKLYVLSIAGALSWMGSTLTTFAVILRDKDSVGAAGVSGYLLVFAIPSILMAPVSGWIADRYSSRVVVGLAVGVMGLSSLTLALGMPLWWTPIALFITACCGAVVGPAWQAAEVSVTAPEDRPRVNGLMQSTSTAGTLIAPALGGILVSQYGYSIPFVIDAVSFWILGATFWLVRINRTPSESAEKGEKGAAIAGLKFVFSDGLIRSLVILLAVLVLALGGVNVGQVFMAKDELHASNAIYGLMSAMFAVGSIIGSLATAAVKLPAKYHALAVVSALILLVGDVMFMSFAWHWGVMFVLDFIAGIGNSVLNAYIFGIIMTRTPSEKLGRVSAAIGATIQTGSVLGLLIAGPAIDGFGVRGVLFVSALVSAVVVLVFSPPVLRAGRAHKGAEPEPAA
jgi:DHA3 family macrolide efflux protein-like MFS transporter